MEKKKTPGRTSRVLRILLRGSVRFFILCILAGVLLTACEMVIPQVIRVTVDSVIGDAPIDLPERVLGWIDRLGGQARLRQNAWTLAAALVSAGVLAAVFRYVADRKSVV